MKNINKIIDNRINGRVYETQTDILCADVSRLVRNITYERTKLQIKRLSSNCVHTPIHFSIYKKCKSYGSMWSYESKKFWEF